MADKICNSCATQNPSHFEYCKHCGAPLPVVDKAVWEEPVNIEHPDFGDISYHEYQRFIGPNSEIILNDFSSTRFGICLPVLFLGMFGGFFGMAAWFFYRKLKKVGFILLAIALVLAGAEAFINASLNKTLAEVISSVDFAATTPEFFSSLFEAYDYYYFGIAKYIDFISAFFISAFAFRIYKKESYKRIMAIKEEHLQNQALPLDYSLSQAGGVSIGILLIPIFVGFLAYPTFFLVSLL